MGGKKLSYETCITVWELVSSGSKGVLVAKVMNISPQLVSRINTIFSAVRDGEEAGLSISTATFTYIIEYAKAYFHPPVKVSKSSESDAGNDLAEVCARLSAISYGITQMNKKLDKLCEAWEVNK